MKSLRSYVNREGQGCLYLVPTPIGNLADMTYRAVAILKEADIIAAEDTRVTKKLCRHFEITTPLISYHEHNKEKQGERLLEQLKAGQTIALVTDAGTPAISDPGSELVSDTLTEDIPVIPLPGANAAVTAIIASGLLTDHFYFYGFLPRATKDKKLELQRLLHHEDPIIFYEAPHRLQETLQQMYAIFGERKATIARELTKKFEEFIRGTLSELFQWAKENQMRGEFCLIVEGGEPIPKIKQEAWWYTLTLNDHVTHYIEMNQLSTKDAIKQTAVDRGVPKREVYQSYHVHPE